MQTIKWNEAGENIEEAWFDSTGEKRHRLDVPALIRRDPPNGSYRTSYGQNDKLHREGNLPTYTGVFDSERYGSRFRECEYFTKSGNHRSDAPAYTLTEEVSGIVLIEVWYRDGFYHRDRDLPAVSYRDRETANITHQQY